MLEEMIKSLVIKLHYRRIREELEKAFYSLDKWSETGEEEDWESFKKACKKIAEEIKEA